MIPLPHGFSFFDPLCDNSLGFWIPVDLLDRSPQWLHAKCLQMQAKIKREEEVPPHLHLLNKSGQGLQPGHHVQVLLSVHDFDLLPQLGDDGARPPAMFQRQIL